MDGQPISPLPDSLARDLRVGLVGSPYDWGLLDFDYFKKQGVALAFTSFPGTPESNRQDFLLSGSSNNPANEKCTILQNDISVLECEIPPGERNSVSPSWCYSLIASVIDCFNDSILAALKEHDDKYVGTEKIIARYTTQVLRVVSVLNRPQVHIENEALAYLIEAPWRNEQELDYLIARLVYFLDGDVLRKPYVQKTVYEFGTSARGVSNSNTVRNLIEACTLDVFSHLDFRTAARLFKIHLAPISFTLPSGKSSVTRRRAA